MKDLNNGKFVLSKANSLEVTKPNSIQGLEGKVTSDRMCDHEEAFKVDNTGVYEHGKITPLSISKPDGAIGNMTVEDEYDNHTWITKGVTKNNNAVSINVPTTTYFLDFTCRKCDNPMANNTHPEEHMSYYHKAGMKNAESTWPKGGNQRDEETGLKCHTIIIHKEGEKSLVFVDIRLTFIYYIIKTEKLGPSWAKLNQN